MEGGSVLMAMGDAWSMCVGHSMATAAITLFGTLRSGGYGKRLFLGIVFALGFYLLQNMAVQMAGVFRFDYRIAFALPPAAMLAVSMWLFKRKSG